MVKILIAIQSCKEEINICQYLTNDNDLKILESKR